MDYPPSAYTLDGMTEVDNYPVIVKLEFYWDNDHYGPVRTNEELAEFMTEVVYSEFDREYMPRYAKYLRPVFDQAIYIDCQELNPYTTGSLQEVFDYDVDNNTLWITFSPSRIPRGWDRNEIEWCFNEVQEVLADTLWESEPGAGFVHPSGAVVDFKVC